MSAASIVFLVFFLLYALIGMPALAIWWSEARGWYRELYQRRFSPDRPVWPYPYSRGGPARGMGDLAAEAERAQDDPELDAARRRANRAAALVAPLALLPPILAMLGAMAWSALGGI